MKIINALRSGLLRSAKSWKAALIITLALFFIISFFTIPFRGVLKSSLGSSVVTGQLAKGINFDILSDLSEVLKNYIRGLSSGLFLIIIAGMLFFTFFSGGLFSHLKEGQGRFSVSGFFRTSAAYFWPFLGITLIVSVILGFVISILIGVVAGISLAGETVSFQASGILRVALILFLGIVLSVFFLVADYSRAHISSVTGTSVFKSVGYGFKMTFGNFVSSVSMMFILMMIQVLFMWFMTKLIFVWKPTAGLAVFLMLITTQVLFFIRIFLRSWRYASVISMMESLGKDNYTDQAETGKYIYTFENNPLAE
ncbi:MAG TPA: hypothetical protein PK521_07875 [Bacteroidales bacterium]|nr:hypothetical protein [Bacteroidales bacterium]HQM69208.1 hypothetical protein [Bacteroidales bacterium]